MPRRRRRPSGASPATVVPGGGARILVGDVREQLRRLPDDSVQTVPTSPPYWGLRSYGTQAQVWGGDPACEHVWESMPTPMRRKQVAGSKQARSAGSPRDRITTATYCRRCGAWLGELGAEPSPDLYVEHLVEVFREIKRVLRSDGTAWLVIGDCYVTQPPGNKPNTTKDSSGLPNSRENLEMRRAAQAHRRDYGGLRPKNLVGIPWRVALALQRDGWILRANIIWHKPNPMPESTRDRPTTAHEHIFLLAKRRSYFFDQEAVREPASSNSHSAGPAGRNIRSVWRIAPKPFPGAHFAVFPEELVERFIKAGTSERGCCLSCGAPWARIRRKRKVESPLCGEAEEQCGPEQLFLDPRLAVEPKRKRRRRTREAESDAPLLEPPPSEWQPTCDCDAGDPVPCIVLDPFLGSGTTAVVALRLGRSAIGIELNPDYAEIAQRRIEQGSKNGKATA